MVKKKKKIVLILIIVTFLILISLFLLFKSNVLDLSKIGLPSSNQNIDSYSERHSTGVYDGSEVLSMMGDVDCDSDCVEVHSDELETFWDNCLYDCNPELFDCYDECDDVAEAEFSEALIEDSSVMNFLDFMPSALAIAPDFIIDDCYDVCDDSYDEVMDLCMDGCYFDIMEYVLEIGCCVLPDEVGIWSGSTITDISGFFESEFPDSIEGLESRCTDLGGGVWTANTNFIGCSDFMYFDFLGRDTCGESSISSAGVVCETIGGVFTCQEDKISCEI